MPACNKRASKKYHCLSFDIIPYLLKGCSPLMAATATGSLVLFLKSILVFCIRTCICPSCSAEASGIGGGEPRQSDAAFRKRQERAAGHSEPFSAACALEASRAFRFRRLSLVLSLASKKERKCLRAFWIARLLFGTGTSCSHLEKRQIRGYRCSSCFSSEL